MNHAKVSHPVSLNVPTALITDLPLLDDTFDESVDFSDAHLALLEIESQFTTHISQ